jgi:hypothetical protein
MVPVALVYQVARDRPSVSRRRRSPSQYSVGLIGPARRADRRSRPGARRTRASQLVGSRIIEESFGPVRATLSRAARAVGHRRQGLVENGEPDPEEQPRSQKENGDQAPDGKERADDRVAKDAGDEGGTVERLRHESLLSSLKQHRSLRGISVAPPLRPPRVVVTTIRAGMRD